MVLEKLPDVIMNNISVIIITVVRNDITHIGETIESVLSQTHNRIQYFIQDGNSNDGTWEVIQEYVSKHPNICAFSETDKGVYYGMNNALSHIEKNKGYVLFMNSGDSFYANDVIEKMIEGIDPDSCSVIYGDVLMHHWAGNFIQKPQEWWKTWKKWNGMGICHQTMFLPLSNIIKLNYNTKYKICADFDLAYRLRKSGIRFEYHPLVVANYSWGNGISSNPFGLIPLFLENGKISGQYWNPIFWLKIGLEYLRLLKKRFDK